MRRFLSGFIFLLAVGSYAQLTINPTTTIAGETENNTSAADSFTTSSNGNLGANNISKIVLRTLLYPNATTNIFVHWIPWHGETGYLNVGYDSADPTEIKRQADDWTSRGVRGTIVDWYGPSFT